MDENIISLIAKELNISISQVKNTLELLEEGATVPFIARYRKERTKGLDEEQIRVIQENYAYQVNLAKRKEEVLARIETLGKLDDEIIKNVNACTKLSQVEDIYRPYKQKKKTRASVAIANGLQPLADTFMSFPRYFNFATSSGVPVATMFPPLSPPSGPRSITWSAHFTTSRLCSMMTMLCPRRIRASKASSSFLMSWKCSPVVGSSKMNMVGSAFSWLR